MPTKESEPTTKSTFTPLSLFPLPDKAALKDEFVGLPIQHLRTPAIIIDRKRFKQNCEKVTLQTEKRGMKFRAHVKSGSPFASGHKPLMPRFYSPQDSRGYTNAGRSW